VNKVEPDCLVMCSDGRLRIIWTLQAQGELHKVTTENFTQLDRHGSALPIVSYSLDYVSTADLVREPTLL
jgi:hypothetical protein